jgi:hypothetical protein
MPAHRALTAILLLIIAPQVDTDAHRLRYAAAGDVNSKFAGDVFILRAVSVAVALSSGVLHDRFHATPVFLPAHPDGARPLAW